MRKVFFVTSLIVATSTLAEAGMPYFNNADRAVPASAPQSSGGWKLPSLWGAKQAAPEPQFIYQPPTAPPTTTERFTQAVTNNPAVNTARNWVSPDPTAAQAIRPDAISLSQPTGKPTPALLVSMAQVREKQGDQEGARQLYQQALAAGPKNVKTLRELGHFEDRQNQLTAAERYYAEAANLAPQNPAVLNDLALCLARQGKPEASAHVLDRAIRLAPKKALYRNNMATVLMELGDQHQAMQHLLAAHPPAAAYYNMGHFLEKGGQAEAAAAHYAEALRLQPNMSPAQTALARVAPASTPSVPQTAMAPSTPAEPTFGPSEPWPSQPRTAGPAATPAANSDFGPRLLPPME